MILASKHERLFNALSLLGRAAETETLPFGALQVAQQRNRSIPSAHGSRERRTHLESGAVERATAVGQPRVDVHRRAASSPAHHPIDVVLLRILPIKREVGPRATVANAAGDEATILGAGATRPGGVYGLELREEVFAVLPHAILLRLRGPLALELIAKLPRIAR